MILKVAIVEDEEYSAIQLNKCIQKYSESTNVEFSVSRYGTGEEFLAADDVNFDIVFLDILMPGINGMETAKRLREKNSVITIIFVTNLAKFAVKGYQVDAFDFMVKPIIYEDFKQRLNRALKVVEHNIGIKMPVKVNGVIKILNSSEITYVEVDEHTLIYHTLDTTYSERGSIKHIEEKLERENFVRCNSCYMVNLRFVTEVNGFDVTVGGDILQISRAKRKVFLTALANYLGRKL